MIKGIAASEGIAIGKAKKIEERNIDVSDTKVSSIIGEIQKFKDALAISVKQLEKLRQKTLEEIDEEHAMIFDAHIQMVNDPEILSQTIAIIENDKYNAAYSFKNVSDNFVTIFESMDNDYMKERAIDLKDITERVIANLLGINIDEEELKEEVIIVSRDLTPSDTAKLDKEKVLGFVTDIGGRTSHSAILSRSLLIPAVVGTKNITKLVKDGDFLIVDGIKGEVIINPTKEEIKKYENIKEDFLIQKELLKVYKNLESLSKDKHKVELAANIGSPEDVELANLNGAEGVGLFRTEFLYMNSDNFPTEDEQFLAYKTVLENIKGKVIIRTLDIGGDKNLSYLKMDEELNPFLGHRALRLCLDKEDLFKTQLKALLRAGGYGDLHIMFPMVATINELKKAKKVLNKCKKELKEANIEYSDSVKVGIMVEIPAVAILADQFAKEVDFFSIGTNDLIQYSFAADRMNEKVSYLYQPFNPSLLRLIKMVIDASHEAGIWTGMCGEMAGEQKALPILLGLGLDEFSMSPSSILRSRKIISTINYKDAKELAEKCLKQNSQEDVLKLIEQFMDGEE